ncbi:MAK10-like protein [Tanacetum coccineum]
MPTEMELTLEQTQQGISYEVYIYTSVGILFSVLLNIENYLIKGQSLGFKVTIMMVVKGLPDYVLYKIHNHMALPTDRQHNESDKAQRTCFQDFSYSNTVRPFFRSEDVLMNKRNSKMFRHSDTNESSRSQDDKVTRWRKQELCRVDDNTQCSISSLQLTSTDTPNRSDDTDLKIRLLKETKNVFELADGTKSYPVGIVRNVEVHIGKLKLLKDMYVIDMEKDLMCPVLVGRGFLATASAIMDCRKAKIAVGEGITRLIFRVKEIDLGVEDVPY